MTAYLLNQIWIAHKDAGYDKFVSVMLIVTAVLIAAWIWQKVAPSACTVCGRLTGQLTDNGECWSCSTICP